MSLRYEVHPQVVCEKVAGRYLLIAYADALGELPYLREINETGAFYWNLAAGGNDRDEMLQQALTIYDASRDILERGLEVFLKDLIDDGYVTEREE